MASAAGRGAQVRLTGDQQAAARGALTRDLAINAAAKRAFEETGVAADGFNADGSTRTGLAAFDEVITAGGIPSLAGGASALRTRLVPDGTSYESFPLPSLTLGSNILASNCQFALAFNDGAGSLVRDYSGNNRHGMLGKPLTQTSLYASPTATLAASGHIQGAKADGAGGYIITQSTGMYKLNSSFAITATNAAPQNDPPAVVPARDHIGGCDIANGVIYACAEKYSSCSTNSGHLIGMWRVSDLTYIGGFDISAQAMEASACTIDTKRGVLWVSSYCSPYLRKYDMVTGAYLGRILMSYAFVNAQGIAYHPPSDTLYVLAEDPGGGARVASVDPTTGTVLTQGTVSGFSPQSISWTTGSTFLMGSYSGGDGTAFTLWSMDPTVTPNWNVGRAGYNFAADYALGIPWSPPDIGAFVVGVTPRVLANFVSLWDQANNSNDWEAWIPANGAVTARIGSTGSVGTCASASGSAKTFTPMQVAYTWSRGVGARLFINGVQSPVSDVALSAWVNAPTMMWIGGISNTPQLTGLVSYAFGLNKYLSPSEAATLASAPYGMFSAALR